MESSSTKLLLLERMWLIRCFEEAVTALSGAGEIPGAVHTSIGQEGTICGACMALDEHDYVTGTHRSHGHPIAKGSELGPLMAELMGRENGVCKGRGGSMHLADPKRGVLSESAIVGGGIPLATGAGLAAVTLGNGRVSLCFFGDGAVNQGTFHESLNMAALWKLPVIYCCENNLYAATTAAEHSHAMPCIAERAGSYGMPSRRVDGQDPDQVLTATGEAIARARAGEGPTLIEACTYRYDEHAVGLYMPGNYRSMEEVQQWRQRDPLVHYPRRLIAEGVLEQAQAQALERQARQQVAAAVEFARSGPQPSPAEVGHYIYA